MKYKKVIIALLYIALLLGCAGMVYFAGRLSGISGWFSERTAESGTPEKEGDGQQGDAFGEKTDEEERLRQERERAAEEAARLARERAEKEKAELEQAKREREAWLEAYRKWRWKNRKPPEEEAEPEEEPYVPPKLMIASDLHYMSRNTHDDGIAFNYMLSQDDGKLSQYSDVVVDELLREAAEMHPSALVLCGDNTLNGEYINHVELAEKLHALQEKGVQVLIIPGNHDIQNENAATYFEADREKAEYLHSAQEFLEIFHEFGYDQAVSRDEASLSYVYALDETHWMMMLDSCQYEDYNHVNGRIRPETLQWMEQWLETAKERQIAVVPVAHHNLLSESRLYTTECTLENHQEVTELLEKYELPLYISGHLHAQRIKKHKSAPGVLPDEYGITEIVMSPFSIPPCQYGVLAWDEQDNMTFETRKVQVSAEQEAEEAALETREAVSETDGASAFFEDFETNAEAFTKELIRNQVKQSIRSVPDNLKEEMANLYAELYYDYCAGNRMSWDMVRTTRAYKLWQRVEPDSIYVAEMGQMIEDVKEDLHDWNGSAMAGGADVEEAE